MEIRKYESKVTSTSAGLSVMPSPRFSDITKAVAVHVVMLSGTVRVFSIESESLQKKIYRKHNFSYEITIHFCTPL